MLLSVRQVTVVDSLLFSAPFISGERRIWYMLLNKRVSTNTG